MQRFKLFVTSAERTQFAQELVDLMSRVEQTYKQTKTMIDRVRCSTQPNKWHRTDDSLVGETEYNERLRYVASLKEAASGGFKETPKLPEYLKLTSDVQEAAEKLHATFLKQVQLFCIKEMRKFTEDTYVNIKKSYSELESRRDDYDLARHKLKSCKPEEVEERGKRAIDAQKDFEKQALALHDKLLKIPDHHMALAKAIYLQLRAENDLARSLTELFSKHPSPNKFINGEVSSMSGTVKMTVRAP